jgi:phosphoglycolate phosphatase-like HAD superfamily hydrolase
MNPKQILIDLPVKHDFFIGFDSDGCIFDTMEIKQKECFCPNLIKYWGLQPISKYARETWEFTNLYSKNRGVNRFLALIDAFQRMNDRKEIKARNFKVPDITPLIEWTQKESKLGNPTLEKYANEIKDPIIDLTLKWSKAVNEDIEEMVFGIAPFPYVLESLQKISNKADSIVVSQTPLEALEREWKENRIDHFVNLIAGQEYGTKTEHIRFSAKDKYDNDKILMVGDAPGDLNAAVKNGILFYPVNPGKEDESWERFYKEALDKFFMGTFKGSYQDELLKEFDSLLPENPHWK